MILLFTVGMNLFAFERMQWPQQSFKTKRTILIFIRGPSLAMFLTLLVLLVSANE